LNDTVTILTTAIGKYITKAFRGPHYQEVQFNPGSEFLVKQIPVNNLESLAAIISDVETEPTIAIIRGSLIKDPSSPVPHYTECLWTSFAFLMQINLQGFKQGWTASLSSIQVR
jgi:hypothetical protein